MERAFKDGFFFFFWGAVFGLTIAFAFVILLMATFNIADVSEITIEVVSEAD